MKELYFSYSMTLLNQNRFNEMFEALENAYEHAKSFDAYFDELRANKEVKYDSPYLDMVTETSEKASSRSNLLFLLDCLEKKDNIHYQKLHHDPRYVELVNRIKADIAEKA